VFRLSSFANHSLTSEIRGLSTAASPTRRTRTCLPSNRNSCGSRTAWLRPLRKSLATIFLATRSSFVRDILVIYIASITKM
jgi:hypothetical protein